MRTWLRSRASQFVHTATFESDLYVQLKTSLNAVSSVAIDFRRAPETDADRRALEVVRMLRPRVTEPGELERVGKAEDGGYVMFVDHRTVDAISIGVGHDVSWDIAIGQRGGRVELFDPTVAAPPALVPNGRFHRVGLAAQGSVDGSFQSLDGILRLGDLDSTGDQVLKIDIEGAEWEALAPVAPSLLRRFRQILLEAHDLSRLKDAERSSALLAVLHSIVSSHAVVHLQANNHASVFSSGAYVLPDVLELTFVRSDILGDRAGALTTRSPLAAPNDPRVPLIDIEGILLDPGDH